MVTVRGEMVLRFNPNEVYEGKNKDGQPFALRSIVGSGSVELDGQVEQLSDLELVCFRQGDKDPLFAGLDKLGRGDRLEVTFTLEPQWMTDAKNRRRLVLKPNRLVACRRIERSTSATRPEYVPTFEDAAV